MYIQEIKTELENHIIPFWMKLRDNNYGGYYGLLDYDLQLHKKADKGVILNSRILWFFSHAYKQTNNLECLEHAIHAYEFLKKHCWDQTYGGLYWSTTYEGIAKDTTKHTYNQAFGLYALSSFYDVTGNEEVKTYAYQLFQLIEQTCKDELGYFEAFDQTFQPVSNEKLSENGLLAEKTMNTTLHVLEAYTEFYRVFQEQQAADALNEILLLVENRIYNSEKKKLDVFFDRNFNTISDLHSYGHDIEASWLLDRACEVLGEQNQAKKIKEITMELANMIYTIAFDGHSLSNECFRGIVDTTRVWWVQAEAVVGFFNAYQKNTSKLKYKEAAMAIWNFIQNHLIDSREGSEWYYHLNQEGEPIDHKEIAGPWKCPYHNGRMCMEVITRMKG